MASEMVVAKKSEYGLGDASMRPRPFGLGNGRCFRWALDGAGSFNEAEAVWPRKCFKLAVPAFVLCHASMRPRPFGLGNGATTFTDVTGAVTLQ